MLGLLKLGIFHLALVLAEFPTDPCFVEGEACIVEADNLLSSLPGVSDLAACRQICQDNDGCHFFSYFGQESFPLTELCLLFSSCSSLHPCEDCRTEEISCFPSACGIPLEGRIGDNNLDIITAVKDEVACKLNCSANPNCNVYTYYNSEDVNFPSLCFLLSEVMEPLQSCEHCSTGVPDCKNITAGLCTFSVGAEDTALTSYYMFEKTGDTTVNIAALGDCELTVLAVGGGGYRGFLSDVGGSSITGHGGGGSGYVVNTSVQVPASQLVVRVGGPGGQTSLQTIEGEIIVTAAPGENGNSYYGGAGYSGGGGVYYSSGSYFRSGNGGEDGGDGYGTNEEPTNGWGGEGSGLDVSSISLQQFSLSPGVGGKVSGSTNYGGGGGGVLVDGTGPQDTISAGEGYGGGGAGGVHGAPAPGLLLLEIIKPKV